MAAVDEDESNLTTDDELVASSVRRLEAAYNEGFSVKENLQTTLSFRAQYQATVGEMKSFLASAEDELNGNKLNGDMEQKTARLKVILLLLASKVSIIHIFLSLKYHIRCTFGFFANLINKSLLSRIKFNANFLAFCLRLFVLRNDNKF